jgi:hypothetical protein
MFSTDEETAAYLLKREQQLYSRLLLHRVFQGTVLAVLGSSPTLAVQVVKTGEAASDGKIYPVTSNWEPAIGDLCDIIWRDDSDGLAAFPVSSAALSRMPARHPYRARFYHTTSPGLAAGWVPLVFSNVEYDPSGRASGGSWIVPVTGTYAVFIKAQTTTFQSELTTGLWYGTSQVAQGSYNQNSAKSVLAESRIFSAGIALTAYIWTLSGTAVLDGGVSYNNSMEICLETRG